MSLHAPFLVKQYLSEDLESGSYSRIFWYFPLEREKSAQGGIGLFFEVLSGDIEDEIYEQITKRFWESFTDHFYTDGFEVSLKRSIKMFIQLLRNFDVEEGLDVNIVLFNVIPAGKGYTLKLISFGDSDIFVVREGQYADMGKMVPVNESLYDLKFLEVELDKGDTLMLGNKTLLRNAFEADMLALDSLDELLRSLELFKENLFGSKKMLIIAATDTVGNVQEEKPTAQAFFAKIPGIMQGLVANAKNIATTLQSKLVKKQETKLAETDGVVLAAAQEIDEVADEINANEVVRTVPKIEEVVEKVEEKEEKSSFVMPPTVVEQEGEEEEVNSVNELDDEVMTTKESLPGRNVTVDDFVVTEEITPAMVVEKSEYQGIVDDAVEEQKKEPVKPAVQPIIPNRAGVNYVQELRAMHSPWAKITRNPTIRSLLASISAGMAVLIEKIMSLFGAKPKVQRNKMYLSRPSSLEGKKIQPGMVIIIVVVILAIILKLRADSKQRATEKAVLQTYQSAVADFMTFYDRNIAVIDKEDVERQLELCPEESQKVLTTEENVLKKLKLPKNRQQVTTLTDQVKVRVTECETKYDSIYGIIRVRNAEVITDFGLSLGNDSLVTSLSLHNGAIVATDKGRKAVYLINVETKSVNKVEDPLGLVVDPVSVGTGEGSLFICDRTNGILYFTANASGNSQGFNRMVGTEPSSIGECLMVDGFGKNAYVIPATGNMVYRIKAKSSGYEQPEKYINNLLGARSLSIDGSIYVVTSTDGVGDVSKYFGGKLDNFAMSPSDDLGELTLSYTNPSNDKNVYVYDKTKNAILAIEKPSGSKHPGRGVVVKTYLLENKDMFTDIKGVAVDVNGNNKEVNMYILAGKTIWKIKL
jgi:hypothetical protein